MKTKPKLISFKGESFNNRVKCTDCGKRRMCACIYYNEPNYASDSLKYKGRNKGHFHICRECAEDNYCEYDLEWEE